MLHTTEIVEYPFESCAALSPHSIVIRHQQASCRASHDHFKSRVVSATQGNTNVSNRRWSPIAFVSSFLVMQYLWKIPCCLFFVTSRILCCFLFVLCYIENPLFFIILLIVLDYIKAAMWQRSCLEQKREYRQAFLLLWIKTTWQHGRRDDGVTTSWCYTRCLPRYEHQHQT